MIQLTDHLYETRFDLYDAVHDWVQELREEALIDNGGMDQDKAHDILDEYNMTMYSFTREYDIAVGRKTNIY